MYIPYVTKISNYEIFLKSMTMHYEFKAAPMALYCIRVSILL